MEKNIIWNRCNSLLLRWFWPFKGQLPRFRFMANRIICFAQILGF